MCSRFIGEPLVRSECVNQPKSRSETNLVVRKFKVMSNDRVTVVVLM